MVNRETPKLDDRIPHEYIDEYASFIDNLPKDYATLDSVFGGMQSLDFYEGMLKGYYNCWKRIERIYPDLLELNKDIMWTIVWLADKIKNMQVVH